MEKYVDEKKTMIELLAEAAAFLTAGIGGGLVKFAYTLILTEEKKLPQGAFLQSFLMAFVGGGCGFIVGEIATLLTNYLPVLFAIAGASGILGVPIVYTLANVAVKLFGKQYGIEIDEIKPPTKPKRKPPR